MLVHNAATSIPSGSEAVPASSRPIYKNWNPVSSGSGSPPSEAFLGPLVLEAVPLPQERLQCHRRFFGRAMAEATTSYASSIEMSSLAPTLSRRDAGLRSVEIGYDEECAEPNSRARIRRKSHRIQSDDNSKTRRLTVATQVPFISMFFAA